METEERYESFKNIFLVSVPAIALNGEPLSMHFLRVLRTHKTSLLRGSELAPPMTLRCAHTNCLRQDAMMQ